MMQILPVRLDIDTPFLRVKAVSLKSTITAKVLDLERCMIDDLKNKTLGEQPSCMKGPCYIDIPDRQFRYHHSNGHLVILQHTVRARKSG